MAFDGVAWAIGGGAVHSDEVARILANAATRDSQGVILPGNMKVAALGTPGWAVTIAPGAAVIRTAQAPGQSYIGRAPSTTQINIAPNNSGAVRHDLVIARVKDPEFSPWSASDITDIATGPYFEPFVVSGVAANIRRASQVVNYAAVELALLSIPNGAAAVTDGMITDLRSLVQPRVGFAFDVQKSTAAGNEFIDVTETAWHDWPTSSITVDVPTWATHAQVSIALNNVSVDGKASDFAARIALGALAPVEGSAFDYNGNDGTPVGFVETRPHTINAEFDVRSIQGQQAVLVRPQVKRIYTDNTGKVWFTPREQIVYDLRFTERVV
jgi:hypothetical protein